MVASESMLEKEAISRMSQLKIAIVSESFGYTSGVGVVIRILIRFFQLLGAEILLIGPEHPTSGEWEGCKTLWLPSMLMKQRGYRRTGIIAPENNKLIIKALQDVNIIFCESISTLVLRVMILKAKRRIHCKVVFHAHTMADRYLRSWFGPLGDLLNLVIVAPITSFCLKVADLRIAPSPFFADYLADTQGFKKPILPWSAPVEIPSDLPDPAETEAGRRVLQFKQGHEFVLVANGRVCKEKRSGHLIRLVLRMRKLGYNVGLVFVGGGEVESFERKVPATSRKHFLFTGLVDRDLGIAINAICDVGVALAITDTQSLSFLEQMAMGLLMAVPDDTVMATYIRGCGCGLVFVSSTVAGMARELGVFLSKRDLDEYGQRGQGYVASNFSEIKQFVELRKIVDQLMAD